MLSRKMDLYIKEKNKKVKIKTVIFLIKVFHNQYIIFSIKKQTSSLVTNNQNKCK